MATDEVPFCNHAFYGDILSDLDIYGLDEQQV